MTGPDHSERIRQLNDEFRVRGPITSERNQWLMTAGVLEMGTVAVRRAVEAVMAFSAFEGGNDPYAEHDFGAFELLGETLFWKIDYYDLSRTTGSPEPANPDATSRVLTLMLASEY